jgi:eukaryotic-like serine/threonine-protein kinase
VVRVLGVGGMATVYEALQENPHRRVAVKVMHQAISHTDAFLRFRLETQTLARLRHPGIAQIYEAGTAALCGERSVPFFAMELVPDAMSITEHVNKRGLGLRERVKMFAGVCDAVLHGHQHGVIHRDIKPANVLVGGDGQVKVIDFGIARSTEPGSKSVTGESDTRKLIGTLNSMSPEQCVDSAGIDVRSDVYSLGVLLFEMVTGRLPHVLTRCTIPEAVRIITGVEAPRAGTINREARGDLEAIIAKAMEKDRAARYAGAGELAADLRRYLNNEPVEARRSTALEQVRKFARRNPPLAAAIAASVVFLIVGIVVSSWFAYSAARARDAARARERELEVVSEFQESMLRGIDVAGMGEGIRAGIASAIRRSSADERGAGGSSDLVADWERTAERVNFTTLAAGTLNASILQRYAGEINERFADQPGLRSRLLHQLAKTMNALGLHTESLGVIREAYAIRLATWGEDDERTLDSRQVMGTVLSVLGKYDEAIEQLRETHERLVRVSGPDSRATLGVGTTLGGAYRLAGRHEEAERIWTGTLERQRRVLGEDDAATLRTLNNMGVLHAVKGEMDKAERCWRELLERRRRLLGEDDLMFRGTLSNLGTLLEDQGRYAEAEPMLRAGLEADLRRYGDNHATTLTSKSMYASLLKETGDLAGAERLMRESYEGRVVNLGPTSPSTLLSKVQLGVILHARGSVEEGERLVREAHADQAREIGEGHPAAIESLAGLRDMAAKAGRVAEALEISERVRRLDAAGGAAETFLGGDHTSVHGELLMASGVFAEALTMLREGHGVLERTLGAGHPRTRRAAGRLAAYFEGAHAREPGAGHDAERAAWAARSVDGTPTDAR